ncbi:hypothetical protein HPT25_14180 [Bacillus sp. BRMEA1]|uniref:hypothetical protein n=1 Tax=Neobacillus endophyticus TaxID=2738405 RepID=UPI001563D4EC|nr:hypothetical protein [Neobacillus endophyticus]NRD78510.1 hypothetical protein [Neobacillus endophyticus]
MGLHAREENLAVTDSTENRIINNDIQQSGAILQQELCSFFMFRARLLEMEEQDWARI